MPAWPGTLPQYPLKQGYQRAGKAGLIRSGMEVGPAKVRRRTTAAVERMQLTFRMTAAERTAFLTFFETTVSGGVERFDFPDPETGATIVCRFAGGANEAPYTITPGAPGVWMVAMVFEVMPA
jgi:hypothetical protein